MNEIPENVVLEWVRVNRTKVPSLSLTPDTPLQGTGLLDSLAFLQLVTFLEQRFGISIDEDEMEPGNFRDARAVADLVRRLGPPGG